MTTLLTIRRVGLIAACTLAAVLGMVIVQIVGAGDSEGGSEYVGGYLLTDRENLAICFDVIDKDQAWAETALQSTQAVWQELSEDPAWDAWGEHFPSPTFDVGCPGTPVVLMDGLRPVDSASKYSLHTYVVADGFLDDGKTALSRLEQLICEQDNCVEVTKGLYITERVAADPQLLLPYLKVALRLARTGPIDEPADTPVQSSASPDPTPGLEPTSTQVTTPVAENPGP